MSFATAVRELEKRFAAAAAIDGDVYLPTLRLAALSTPS
jgi:hypothetical protein